MLDDVGRIMNVRLFQNVLFDDRPLNMSGVTFFDQLDILTSFFRIAEPSPTRRWPFS